MALAPMSTIFTDTHYKDINSGLNKIAKLMADLDRIEAAGIPVDDLRNEILVRRNQFERLKQAFWPERS